MGIEGIEVVADKLLNVYAGSDDQDLYAFGLTGGGMKTATQRPDPKDASSRFRPEGVQAGRNTVRRATLRTCRDNHSNHHSTQNPIHGSMSVTAILQQYRLRTICSAARVSDRTEVLASVSAHWFPSSKRSVRNAISSFHLLCPANSFGLHCQDPIHLARV